ncbi:hypothetical protein MTO96_049694 [Rhipicephalus appendiculatus]
METRPPYTSTATRGVSRTLMPSRLNSRHRARRTFCCKRGEPCAAWLGGGADSRAKATKKPRLSQQLSFIDTSLGFEIRALPSTIEVGLPHAVVSIPDCDP